jgi:hypothetical protein
LRIAGLNTAWWSQGDNEKGQLPLGLFQVNDLLSSYEDHEFVVSMMHHPLEWLPEWQKNVHDAVFARSHLLLHGHVHESSAMKLISPRRARLVFGGGAAYAGSKWANSFQILEFLPESRMLKVHPFLLQNGDWIFNANAFLSRGVGEFTLD